MTSPLLTALATLGLALSAFVADSAFAVEGAGEAPAVETAAQTLRPGEFIWRVDEAAGSPLIVISIPQQRLFLFQERRIAAVSTVSTGRRGHRTPPGTFQILEKRRKHFSNRYDNAPMPFMQRLTWDGVALHAGSIPGYPASHGCVRLPARFARMLFAVTRVGVNVMITDNAVDLTAPLAGWLPAEVMATMPAPADAAAIPPAAAMAVVAKRDD